MGTLLKVRYVLVAAALLFGFSALLLSGIIRQTEAAVASSGRYDIAWSGANARQELSTLGQHIGAYLAFKRPEDREKVDLFYTIVHGRLDYLRHGTFGEFMSGTRQRQQRLGELQAEIYDIGGLLPQLDDALAARRVLDKIEKAARVLDRIKNEAQAAAAGETTQLAADMAHKQTLLNILLAGLLGSCLLLLGTLARQNRLLGRASESSARKSREFAHLASHDALTGLPNRAALKNALSSVLDDAGSSERLGMLVIDLDGFKPINDTLGHMVGDELLISAARRIEAAVADGCDALVSRFGGDEFVVLLRKLEQDDDAQFHARAILAELRKPYEVNGHALIVDASIGVATASGEDALGAQLLHHADIALNEAKHRGKGTVALFTPAMLETLSRRAQIEQELTSALANGQIHPHYQVQVDLGTGRIVGLEALARWQHPRRGTVLPADFIAVAEMSGQIVELGRAMLEQACQDLRVLPEHMEISVNVSAAQLFQDDFAAFVERVLEETGLEAGRLTLEITETAMLSDAGKAKEAIAKLKALGVSMSLDDFGTGYSSLSYLRDFGFDELKIDHSFVKAMGTDLKSLSVVQAIIDLGKKLEVEVVPEGIETAQQAALLRALGCGRGQGYLFGRPEPIAVVMALISGDLQHEDLPAPSAASARHAVSASRG